MPEEEPTPEIMRIMVEDATDLSNSIWGILRAYDVDNRSFDGRQDVLLNCLTTVVANVLNQMGNEANMSQLCAAFWYEILCKVRVLMHKDNNDEPSTNH
jgi:adenosyl cobinamide kinase/adenosyl cobinamide phosphate guanylyltransferase